MPEGCPTICDPSFTGTVTIVESIVWNTPSLIQTVRFFTYKRGKLITVSDPIEEVIFTAEACS